MRGEQAHRYAIYFAPEPGSALGEFGWSWLGRRPDRPDYLPLARESDADNLREPRHYGFHATLKPPFRLAQAEDRDSLLQALRDFAARSEAFTLPPFVLSDRGGFLALRPDGPAPAIHRLADACVRVFDRFRAVLSDAERQKRLAQPLSDRQRDHLERWGYPYVFEDFAPHLTLTGRLLADQRPDYAARISAMAGAALREPVAFRSICLFEQGNLDQPFCLTERVAMTG